jgi:hypothetical protein
MTTDSVLGNLARGALIVVVWGLGTTWVLDLLGTGALGLVVASVWPLLPLGLLFAVIWIRGARHRRRLLDEEFR